MDAMTIIRRCRAAKEEIRRIRQRIAQREEILTNISAPQPDPIGGGRGTSDPDKAGRIMGDIDELERLAAAREEEWLAEQVAVSALLDMVPSLENEVLFLYYMSEMSTTEIARKKKYTPGYVRKVKRNGEQLLAMLTPERVESTLPLWYLKKEKDRKKA